MSLFDEWNVPSRSDVYEILETEGVIAVVGTGRSGKTALAHLLAASSSKPVVVLAYPDELIEKYCPDDWSSCFLSDVFGLKDCVLLFDDAALAMSSRDFSSSFQKDFVRFQTVISHKNITLMFVVQNLQLLDIGTLRSQRLAILYKDSNANNIRFEREEYQGLAATAVNAIRLARLQLPDHHHKSFVFDDSLGKVWVHPLAEHWNPKLSVPYRDFHIHDV